MILTRHWRTSLSPIFIIKSKQLEILSSPLALKRMFILLLTPQKFTTFTEVTQDTVDKIIRNSPTKSCLLDPWPTFLIKECSDILLPSLTKLVNCSLMEDCIPDGFKTAVVSPLLKRLLFLQTTLGTIVLYLSLVSCQN